MCAFTTIKLLTFNSLTLLVYTIGDEEFETFKMEMRHLRSRQDDLESRVEKLEELAKIGTLRTCAEYAQYGLKTSGLYMIDPDGPLLGHPPFQVFCNFTSGECESEFYRIFLFKSYKTFFLGSTEVMHDTEQLTEVEHCPEPGK